eukprot:SM000027S09695  [mRNA]  locus=s27:788983:790473:+ [translate_table: standard]
MRAVGSDATLQGAPAATDGEKLSLLWLLCTYNAEAAYFDEGVRSSQRKLLLLAIGKLVQPAYTATVAHHCTAALVAFKEAVDWQLATDNDVPFAEAANAAMRAAVERFDAKMDDVHVSQFGWDTAKLRRRLLRDLHAHVTAMRWQRLAAIAKEAEAIMDPCRVLLKEGTSKTLRKLLQLITQTEHKICRLSLWPQFDLQGALCWEAEKSLLKVVKGYTLQRSEAEQMMAALAAAGRECIRQRAREAANDALIAWCTGQQDTKALATGYLHSFAVLVRLETVRIWYMYLTVNECPLQAVRVLAVTAAVHLSGEQQHPDTIEATLLS